MKTLALSESSAAFGLSCATMEHNPKKGHRNARNTTKVFGINPSTTKNVQDVWGNPGGYAIMLVAAIMSIQIRAG
jgi:hypothetical protein